jgi:hypothetical protein
MHTASAQSHNPIPFSWKGLHRLLIQYENSPTKSNTMKVYNYLSSYQDSCKITDTLGLVNTFELA